MKRTSVLFKNRILSAMLLVCSMIISMSCDTASNNENQSLVNLSHLNHLYEEIELHDQTMAIIHIYADSPDYNWMDAPGEGSACLDDVARAAIVYLNHYQLTQHAASLQKATNLLRFILMMQADNGLFYNFIHSDLSINKRRSNSLPVADWWTWRALWALSEFYTYFSETDESYADFLMVSIERVFPAIDSILNGYPTMVENHGIEQPIWLPFGTAADQASVIITALSKIYQMSQDTVIRNYLTRLSEGILKMQVGDSAHFPYSAFLSWQNTWHAWGNNQSYGLFLVAKTLKNDNIKMGALSEVDYFLPYVMQKNYFTHMVVTVINDSIIHDSQNQFPQIAYDIRPMVWASLQAFQATGDPRYARQAGEIACWILGKNISNSLMYDPRTGRCYDGIESAKEINLNSGAESTIEALLILLEIESNKIARDIVHTYYKQHRG